MAGAGAPGALRGTRPGLRARVRAERGSAAAETALVLPAVVMLLTCLIACGSVVIGHVRCLDAARAAARLAARGESPAAVVGAASGVAPAGARVNVAQAGGLVTVVVAATVRLPLPGGPQLDVSASATSASESAP